MSLNFLKRSAQKILERITPERSERGDDEKWRIF
jgi:hypothetical protein